jgi:hypothetical protein
LHRHVGTPLQEVIEVNHNHTRGKDKIVPYQKQCILREEEGKWTGRIYEDRLEDGALEYTYAVIAPLRFEGGHVVTGVPVLASEKVYQDLEEITNAMRHALHEHVARESSIS